MNQIATRTAAALLVAAFGIHGSCLAGENSVVAGPERELTVLARTKMSAAELGQQYARGLVIGSALSDGNVIGNSVGPRTISGTVMNDNSINNNSGITTVFQNTGNNSLFQQSLSIFITVN